MEDYSQILAEFVSEFSIDELPEAVFERSRQSVINGVAAGLSASRAKPVDLLLNVLGREGGSSASPLFGRPERPELLHAVLINAYMAHYDDFDDTHRGAQLHTNPSTVPVLLGLGGARHVPGREALGALALGIEASIRLGMAVGESHGQSGWHTTGTMGTLGAGLTACRLIGLDSAKTNMALGLSLTQAAGLRGTMFGTMAKGFNAAKAAHNGLLAALLAEQGFTAGSDAIEGSRAYVTAATNDADLSQLTDGLGSRWEVERVGFKPYASGAATHATVDAALALRRELGLGSDSSPAAVAAAIDQLDEVQFTMHEGVTRLPHQREIDEPLQAKFSCYNVAALVLTTGRAGPSEYNDQLLINPTIARLRGLIDVIGEPAVPNGSGSVRAKLKGGREINIHIDHALGTIGHPLDDAALRHKLFEAATGVFRKSRLEEIAATIEQMNTCQDVSSILELIAG